MRECSGGACQRRLEREQGSDLRLGIVELEQGAGTGIPATEADVGSGTII